MESWNSLFGPDEEYMNGNRQGLRIKLLATRCTEEVRSSLQFLHSQKEVKRRVAERDLHLQQKKTVYNKELIVHITYQPRPEAKNLHRVPVVSKSVPLIDSYATQKEFILIKLS